jgi:hypothetical protein
LCSQVVGGGEYVSPTGGQGGGNSSLSRDIKNLTLEDKLKLGRTQLEEVRRVQGEGKEMRTRIADKFAEHLPDNMTSCFTQYQKFSKFNNLLSVNILKHDQSICNCM